MTEIKKSLTQSRVQACWCNRMLVPPPGWQRVLFVWHQAQGCAICQTTCVVNAQLLHKKDTVMLLS